MDSIFDEDGKLVDREALDSVGFSGQGMSLPRARRDSEGNLLVPWRNENDGGVGGVDTLKSDGGRDVHVFARPGLAGSTTA